MLKFSLLLLLVVQLALGLPLAPTTSDGATPIDAQVSAADFGALDAFAEDVADSSERSAASEAGFKVRIKMVQGTEYSEHTLSVNDINRSRCCPHPPRQRSL